MYDIRERVLKGEFVSGTWLSLASPVTAEIVGLCGFDWALLDAEHAPSTTFSIMEQMQAMSRFKTAPIVRVPWLDRVHMKWALDIGCAGIMIPYIETVEQAREAVAFMRYAPQGSRGVGAGTRASNYGFDWPEYSAKANTTLLGIAQMETQMAVDNSRDIAALDGIDILFVGPMDLSTSIGMPKRFADPAFLKVLEQISQNAHAAGKAAGILLPQVQLVPTLREMGYTFIAVSSDVSLLAQSMKKLHQDMIGQSA